MRSLGQLARHVHHIVDDSDAHRVVGRERRVGLHIHIAVDAREGLGTAPKCSDRDAHGRVLAAAHQQLHSVEVVDRDAGLGLAWLESVGHEAARGGQALECAREALARTPLDAILHHQRLPQGLQQENHRVHNRGNDDDYCTGGADAVCGTGLDDKEVEEGVDSVIARGMLRLHMLWRAGQSRCWHKRALDVHNRGRIHQHDAVEARVALTDAWGSFL
mmetsp:Transcript_18004/g.45389  ORF Transcript_18004/g.45389 Transcript_18004/m.45389 type:complete len:218 (+) Transcript_18004:508-1161(+)